MKRKIIIICLFILGLLCFVNYGINKHYSNNYSSFEQFTKEIWGNNPFGRIYVVEDMMKKYDISSMNKDEIVELLGREHCVISNDHITYTLGKKKEDLLFSYCRIDLDENGNAINVTIYQD